MSELRLATRRSPLALAQAHLVAGMLADKGVETSIVPVVSTGDRDRVSPVTTLTEVGAFVRAIQQAVLDGRADVAVHSGKDLPVDGPDNVIGFYPERAAPWDVLCGATLDGLEPGAVVGTGSPRRTAQLRRLRPEIEIVGIRGNVGTRLDKVAQGEVAAIMLAEAGLARLGMSDSITQRLSLEQMVPAPAQAALTLEAIAGSQAAEILAGVDHLPSRRAVEAERALLALTGAGCRSALGAYATAGESGSIDIVGFVEDEVGARRGKASGDTPGEAAAALQVELGL